jgi:hypothetical protein
MALGGTCYLQLALRHGIITSDSDFAREIFLMDIASNPATVQHIVQEIDRLIAEMTTLRSQVSALDNLPIQPDRSA